MNRFRAVKIPQNPDSEFDIGDFHHSTESLSSRMDNDGFKLIDVQINGKMLYTVWSDDHVNMDSDLATQKLKEIGEKS